MFYIHLPSILYRFDVISAFVIAEDGRKTISAARGRARPEVKTPFDSLTPICDRSVFGIFRSSFTCPKLFDFFDLHVKCPLKILGKGYSPCNIFFIDETPKKHFLGAIRVVLDIVRANRFSGLVCRLGSETKKGKIW
jgi:hypothetical protein